MSNPNPLWPAWNYINDNLKNRQLLTFNVTGQPVSCLFYSSLLNSLVLDTLEHYLNTNLGSVGSMLVWNPSSQALESLEAIYNNFVVLGGFGSSPAKYAFFGINTSLNKTPASFQITTSPTSSNLTLAFTDTAGVMYYLAFMESVKSSVGVLNSLVFCQAQQGFQAVCPQADISVQLLNNTDLGGLPYHAGAVQDPNTLCCYSDVPSIIGWFLTLTVPLSQVSNSSGGYTSLSVCQQADTKCACPTLTTCWMYNKSNVPCCIQGNPSDSRFANDPAIVFQAPSDCISAAKDCSRWSFNTVDVPCCIQRSANQWSSAGYSMAGYESYDTLDACTAASNQAGTCTFQSLLSYPTNLRDYYKLFLESQYTSGCDQLRTAQPWASAASCASLTNPLEQQYCYSGNCGVNHCGLWNPVGTSSNPTYVFSQNVRCLPPAEQCACPGNTPGVVCNPGQPGAFFSCSACQSE